MQGIFEWQKEGIVGSFNFLLILDIALDVLAIISDGRITYQGIRPIQKGILAGKFFKVYFVCNHKLFIDFLELRLPLASIIVQIAKSGIFACETECISDGGGCGCERSRC